MDSIVLFFNGGGHLVHPLYGNNIECTKEQVSGQKYFRTAINGTFVFIGEDYDLIHSQPLGTEFTLSVSKDYMHLADGVFHKTDCTFDTDCKRCEVRLGATDLYDKILSSLDDEYDLVQLAPERDAVTYKKRGILQIVAGGDSKVTNIIGNSSYETDLKEEFTSGYGFVSLGTTKQFTVRSRYLEPNIYDGVYEHKGGAIYERLDGEYSFVDNILYDKLGNIVWSNFHTAYQLMITETNYTISGVVQHQLSSQTTLVDANVSGVNTTIYARVLTDNKDLSGAVLRTNDIYEGTLNYRYYATLSTQARNNIKLVLSNLTQEEPTPYMKDENGMYYVKPSPSIITKNVIPVGWSKWGIYSFWVEVQPALFTTWLDRNYAVVTTLNDAYPLEMAIKVLLRRIDENIEWCENEDRSIYSSFLFGANNDYVNPITREVNKLFITPITNIKNSYYTSPAQQGKITLGQIFEMLRKTYQVYWFMEQVAGRKRLRLEHISWFASQGSIDITKMIAPRNGKPWSYKVTTYSFDKDILPKRYEFGWQENGTQEFNGYPLAVKDTFVSESNTYDGKVVNFFPDIDFILSHPEGVGNDCFALLATDIHNDVLIKAVYVQRGILSTPTFYLQNGVLSFLYLENKFYIYNAPSNDIEIEVLGMPLRPTTFIKARRMSDIVFPYDVQSFADLGYKSIITELGEGEIVRMTLNLCTQMAKADIRLKTDDTE